VQRFAFYIDSERNKACNLHVAHRPLTKGVFFAPGNTDVTRKETMKARLENQIAIVAGSSLRQIYPILKPRRCRLTTKSMLFAEP
jgi:hypothetical protein